MIKSTIELTEYERAYLNDKLSKAGKNVIIYVIELEEPVNLLDGDSLLSIESQKFENSEKLCKVIVIKEATK